MAMIVAGGPLYAAYAPSDVFISLFCHGTIYLCGFVTIGTEVCSAAEAPKLALGVALVAVRTALLRPFAANSEGLLVTSCWTRPPSDSCFPRTHGRSLCRCITSPSRRSYC